MKKFVSLLLALVMVFSLAACGDPGTSESNNPGNSSNPTGTGNPVNTDNPDGEDEPYVGIDWEAVNAMTWEDASDVIYEFNLGEYAGYYAAAKAETDNLDLRLALMAIAEAKLIESGTFIPIYTNGGNYAMSRTVPKTISSTLWGMDNYRYQHMLVTNELIKSEDIAALKALWGEADTADDYYADAKAYLAEHGYTLKRNYTYQMDEPVTWDILHTSQTSDSDNIIMTLDLLLEYDCKGVQQPALATSYEVKEVPGTYTTADEDGNVIEVDTTLVVYTFHIREGVQWVDQQGRYIADVQADDWVAAMEHLADNPDELGYLLSADGGCGIKNFDAYTEGLITDFSEVGVKAVDKYTLEYTLQADFPPFITMMSYGCFAPLCREFYLSQGGKFGAEFDASASSYNYGKSPANIAYCGPYLITNYTSEQTVAFKANPTYWNADTVTLDTITLNYYDGSDVLKAYNDTVAGTLDGCGFNASALQQARTDIDPVTGKTYFDAYHYTAIGSVYSYSAWFNLNRQLYTNYNDTNAGVSAYGSDAAEALRTKNALSNANFRVALGMALDRGSYNAQRVGEELKYVPLRNSYTPGTFKLLETDVTVSINGSSKTFPAGTWYGQIMQAQLDADGYPIQVWSDEADDGAGSGDGFDGWYNPANAKIYLEKAIAELAQIGVEVSAANPIHIDYPGQTWSETGANMAQVFKQTIEESLDGKVVIHIIEYPDSITYQNNGYRAPSGAEMNYDLNPSSGWGPDYGDPQTFLDTLQPYGYMTMNIGMW